MTAETRSDRELPAILEDLYLGPSPDYRDEVMAAAARVRQRPSWTFAGRWFPMADITRPALAPRVPWRAIGATLIVVALILAAAAILATGSRQTKVPPPFGPARNGLITYAADGDIYLDRSRHRDVDWRHARSGSRTGPGLLTRRHQDRLRARRGHRRRRAERGRRASHHGRTDPRGTARARLGAGLPIAAHDRARWLRALAVRRDGRGGAPGHHDQREPVSRTLPSARREADPGESRRPHRRADRRRRCHHR